MLRRSGVVTTPSLAVYTLPQPFQGSINDAPPPYTPGGTTSVLPQPNYSEISPPPYALFDIGEDQPAVGVQVPSDGNLSWSSRVSLGSVSSTSPTRSSPYSTQTPTRSLLQAPMHPKA